jgi:WS/DGAT/MGAT family acyltransferase
MRRTRVAGADRTWWQVDRPENPMMITGLMWFATPVTEDELLAVLQERLVDRYPKFAARIVHEGGRALWDDDPTFDLRAHLTRVRLPSPGGQAALEAWVAHRMSTRLDRERPLWHVDLVEDVEGGSAIVVRLHHVVADGISLARVLLQLADGAEADAPRRRRGVLDRAREAFARGAEVVGDLDRWIELARLGAASAASAARLLALPPDPPSVLDGDLGARKVAAWMAPLALDRVKAVGRRHGATVNDVLMTALSLALGAWLREGGDDVDEVRSFVPVNLRPLDRPVPRELGNQFGLVVLALPLRVVDPLDALAEMKRRMDTIKRSPEAIVTYGVLHALPAAPDGLEPALVDFFARKASLITTNVPGPRERLRIAGHEVTGILCWVPQSAGVSLGVSILSYAGEVRVGVAGDARRVPDPHALVRAYEAAFAALEVAT